MSTVLSEVTTDTLHDRMLSPRDVAGVLGVSRDYVYELVNSGALPSKKIGANRRVWMSDLRSFVDSL